MSTLISGIYDIRLLILSVAIALLAAYTALDLAGQVRTSFGYAQIGWLIGGAIAMGTGIWSMHFVGMLAFCLPIPVKYDIYTVLISILAAIFASGCALLVVSREVMGIRNLLAGSLLMGIGITTMHYTGMAAMRLPASIHYNYLLVGISGAIAFIVSFVALWLAFHLPDQRISAHRKQKIVSAIIMGAAIPIVHYTGMAATSFHVTAVAEMSSVMTFDSSVLSTTIGIVTFAILGLALLISLETTAIERTVALANLEHEIVQRQQVEKLLQQEQARKLEQALQQLQLTQAKLVHTEKISSLGQLVAGVAHEVNNPVNFISGNLSHANNYIQDLIALIDLYRQQFPNPGMAIDKQIKTIDLEYLLADLPKIISSMKLGIDRIQEIMKSLRNFSRVDGTDKKLADIHQGINTTLMILQHRLKAQPNRPAIQVVKQYGNLPQVECYIGQLNQVLMNLLANAIDALEESNNDKSFADLLEHPNVITISTSSDDSYVIIRIADNGTGMSEEVRSHLFDAFFTTKSEGKGTGLGLAISHQIITEIHAGSLHCVSALGTGTEFIIQIPLLTAVPPSSPAKLCIS
ncbi:integral membrane sensor signal transduction histidine kinase [Calothrix sp. NIES-2100]|uniref:MHYT domain-containing protein n=1 Tax=Calothrix sp. NIES-2100 TaxID=1954172 RepID=UPI000B609649|nr:integral membrane sensor signal transduction histidine kinase [Calothrix sp. NIES-2100]